MARTNQQRYDGALAHIRNIDNTLANDIDGRLGAHKATVGGDISLGGEKYWKHGTAAQHYAVRALLLCHIAYFRPPHAGFDYATATALTDIKRNCLHSPQSAIDGEIEYFVPMAGASLNDLAAAAEHVKDVTGMVNNFTRTRDDTNVSLNPVCYHGVVSWLFAAGFISKRWLAKEGNTLTAYTANNYLGDGSVVPQSAWGAIPRGYLWNIHRVGDPSTCHWGVSLGGDVSVACNNTDSSPTATLNYIEGNTQYGKFKFSEICTVLNGTDKYGHKGTGAPMGVNIVVRQIDPTAMGSYY